MGIALEHRGPKKGYEGFFVNKVKDPSRGPLYEVHTDNYLNTGWGIFKLYPVGFIGFSIIELISITIYLILWAKFSPLLGFLFEVAMTPLYMGTFIVSAKLLQRQPCLFGDFFSGFHYFKPLVIIGFFYGIIDLIDYFFPQQTLAIILSIIALLLFTTVYFFTPLLIIDRRLDWWTAMEKSRRTVQRRPLQILRLNLLFTLIALGGIIALGVGFLVTLPLVFCAITAAYADIFGFRSKKY
jgi:hypothetical protein